MQPTAQAVGNDGARRMKAPKGRKKKVRGEQGLETSSDSMWFFGGHGFGSNVSDQKKGGFSPCGWRKIRSAQNSFFGNVIKGL
jgi:hypothetical protein